MCSYTSSSQVYTDEEPAEETGTFWDGGYIATRLMPNKFKYANCRNTGTLAGDLAETNFVLFLTKMESLFERDFQIVPKTNILMKFNLIPMTDNKGNNFVSWIFIRPWFPALSLGHLQEPNTYERVRVKRSRHVWLLFSHFRHCTAGLKKLMRVTIDKQMKMQYINRIIECI